MIDIRKRVKKEIIEYMGGVISEKQHKILSRLKQMRQRLEINKKKNKKIVLRSLFLHPLIVSKDFDKSARKLPPHCNQGIYGALHYIPYCGP